MKSDCAPALDTRPDEANGVPTGEGGRAAEFR